MSRRADIEIALRRLAPRIPAHEFGAVVDHALDSRGLGPAAAEAAAWLSLVAYVRHALTDYDELLAEGYGRESARHFVAAVLIAFLPAVVVGVLAHDVIKTVLFETPMLIAVMLILGGLVLLWVDRRPERPDYRDVMDFPLPMALKIGLFQCLAMIPGVSRSGATIVGALLLGADKRSAAEFSFFLSMPTMAESVQSPSSMAPAPLCSHRLPSPNGSSTIGAIEILCGTSRRPTAYSASRL